MTEPILDTNYWKDRLERAEQPHHAVFRCPLDKWLRIEGKHRSILARVVNPADAILDVGCGWGRLLKLIPVDWRGSYCGIDLSNEFIEVAKSGGMVGQELMLPATKTVGCNPNRCQFIVADMLEPPHSEILRACRPKPRFDLAVLISIRPMVRRNLGEAAWAKMELNVKSLAERLLFLEYDEEDEGSLE